MYKAMRSELLSNRDDLQEGTFCYTLFEENLFVPELLHNFVASATACLTANTEDNELKVLLAWVLPCVDLCFASHHDTNDLYFIKNYTTQDEENWNTLWRPSLEKLITPSHIG